MSFVCLAVFVSAGLYEVTMPLRNSSLEAVKANSISNPDSFTSKPSNIQHLLSEESV